MDIAELYEEYESALIAFALRLTHDSQWADDLVQDTIIRAMGHLPLLSQLKRHQRRAWLFRTLKNRYLDEKHAQERHDRLLQEAASDPTTALARGQRFDLAPNPFDLVPEQYQELVHLRYVMGMNSTEIGEEMGIPAATVRSRLHLAMKQVRLKKHELE